MSSARLAACAREPLVLPSLGAYSSQPQKAGSAEAASFWLSAGFRSNRIAESGHQVPNRLGQTWSQGSDRQRVVNVASMPGCANGPLTISIAHDRLQYFKHSTVTEQIGKRIIEPSPNCAASQGGFLDRDLEVYARTSINLAKFDSMKHVRRSKGTDHHFAQVLLGDTRRFGIGGDLLHNQVERSERAEVVGCLRPHRHNERESHDQPRKSLQ